MYYYIFDPPQGAKEYERTAQIKDLLTTLGIAGEMTSPIPGKSVEDLVHLAVAKRYSTIIAVGGMELINRVARAIEPYDVVFGIVPTIEHADIGRLIGVTDWKSAAEQLKRRRWQTIRLGLINNQIAFLTPATIQLSPTDTYELKTPRFTLTGTGGSLLITPVTEPAGEDDSIIIDIHPAAPTKRSLLSNLFGGRSTAPEESRFMVENVAVSTSSPAAVTVAGTTLATTPVSCTAQVKTLKLIVGKGLSTLDAR